MSKEKVDYALVYKGSTEQKNQVLNSVNDFFKQYPKLCCKENVEFIFDVAYMLVTCKQALPEHLAVILEQG